MYLVDANILVYSADEGSEHHAAARDWLDERTAGAPRSVGLPWPSLLAFSRLVTNPRVYSPPAMAADAWQRIEDWLSRPAAWIPVPGSRHQQALGGIIRECRPAGNLVPDAHLAALAVEHGLTVVSTDTDFARFPSVAWLNPVSATALGRLRRSAMLARVPATDNLDPASVAAEDLPDLRAVAEAAEWVRRDEALVTERVALAFTSVPAGDPNGVRWLTKKLASLRVRRRVHALVRCHTTPPSAWFV